VKFHETLSGGSRDFLRRGTDRRAEMTKLRVAFGNFANTLKKRKKKLDHYGVYVYASLSVSTD
jgi:hypothetical protein